jgi:hypothetical protein
MPPKREGSSASAAAKPAKATAVECEFCGKVFKARGLKLHQNKCSLKKSPTPLFEFVDTNTFANILGFLGNQSLVKLQSITGGRYGGSDALVSSICCPCENDELAVANGLCLACNQAKDPEFRETITTTEARRVYGIHDIDSVPHTTVSVYHRGYYCLFKYADVDQYAQTLFGSTRAWLEMLSAKVRRRRKLGETKRKKAEAYSAILAQLPPDFVEFLAKHGVKPDCERVRKEQAERFEAMAAALAGRNLHLEPHIHSLGAKRYVLHGAGGAARVADSIVDEIQATEASRRAQDEARAFLKTLPPEFAKYLSFRVGKPSSKAILAAQADRFKRLTLALTARELTLRSDSVLCRQYIIDGSGELDEVVDTMEEMKFLFAYTSYASECRAILPQRERNYGWSDSEDEDDWIPAAELQRRRERVKLRIRDSYLRDSRGLTLPRKWQRM